MFRSWDNSVSIATRLRTGPSGFDSRQGQGILLFATASRPTLGPTHPSIQWVLGALSPGVKRPGREADHSPHSSAEVQNAWSHTSTHPYVFVAWYLVKWSTIMFVVTNICRMQIAVFWVVTPYSVVVTSQKMRLDSSSPLRPQNFCDLAPMCR
jgi:hypothetical protein